MKIENENLYKDVSLIIISHKSKKNVLNFLEHITNKFKIIVIENSEDQTIKEELLKKDLK